MNVHARGDYIRFCSYGMHFLDPCDGYYTINPEGGYGRHEVLCCEHCIKKPEHSAALERMIEAGATELEKYRNPQMNDNARKKKTATTPVLTPTPPPAPVAKKREPREPLPYKVRDRISGDVIYVIANGRSQAENFAKYYRFEVRPLHAREAIGLKPEQIFDATKQPGPPEQLKLAVGDPE